MSAHRSTPVNRDELGELPGLTLTGHFEQTESDSTRGTLVQLK
jgi:hypothetical protein